ncbi:hypothetical protein DL93DRAFT_2066521, partial [Clavulina sp. PMI_390]
MRVNFSNHLTGSVTRPVPLELTKLIYHQDSTIPAAPEWLAFDHEMSLSVMEVFYDSPDVFLRTYRTTRDLNMLLLDGSSAFLSTTGSVDFQFVLLDGQV